MDAGVDASGWLRRRAAGSLVRELGERLGLTALMEPHLTDSQGKDAQILFAELLQQSE
jgi:hypothetical protein